MHITWYGQSFFKIITQNKKDGLTSIVIDPFSKTLGLRIPKTEASILLITDQNKKEIDAKSIDGTPFLIDEPGEYDIKQIFVNGIPAKDKNEKKITIYTIEAEGIKLCHLGKLGKTEITEDQLEKIGDADILIIPIGGNQTINSSGAAKIIKQIEPRIVIPMVYQIPKLKEKLETIDEFLKTMGMKSIEAQNKLTIKKKDMPNEMEIIRLVA